MKAQKIFIHISATAALFAAAIVSPFLHADDPVERSWTNPDGGDFGVGTNWSGNTFPGTLDSALFDLGGEYTVDFGAPRTNDRLTVRSGTVTFDLSATNGPHTYTLTNPNTLDAGQSSITVGFEDGDNAALEITNGTLAGVRTIVGDKVGATGSITIGQGGIFTNSNTVGLYVGQQGSGSMIVTNGGSVTSQRGAVGRLEGTGSATVTGSGSSWTTNGLFIIGSGTATGNLTISNGGTVTNNGNHEANLGRGVDSTGIAVVTGSGSTWAITNNSLYVGGLVSGAAGDGSLTVSDGGLVSASGEIKIWEPGSVTGNGTLAADVVNRGTISPGNSTGTLSINGDFTQEAAGLLDIEIGGTSAGLYDILSISGTASLGGSLAVTLVDEFMLGYFQSFQILDASAAPTGTFDGLGEGALVGTYNGIDLFITYDPEEFGVSLYTIPEPSAFAGILALCALVGVMLRRSRK